MRGSASSPIDRGATPPPHPPPLVFFLSLSSPIPALLAYSSRFPGARCSVVRLPRVPVRRRDQGDDDPGPPRWTAHGGGAPVYGG